MPNSTLVAHELPDALEYRRRAPETTVLYRVVQHHLETFLASARDRRRVVPRFVERELRAFLACGILAHGFLRVRCQECGHERLVAFSCKKRGFCPSCGGRRMADTAAHLVDRVLPEAPVRQYVLSLPFALRYRLAFDAELCSEVLRIFIHTVFSSLRRRARRMFRVRKAYCGSVTLRPESIAHLLDTLGQIREVAVVFPDRGRRDRPTLQMTLSAMNEEQQALLPSPRPRSLSRPVGHTEFRQVP